MEEEEGEGEVGDDGGGRGGRKTEWGDAFEKRENKEREDMPK